MSRLYPCVYCTEDGYCKKFSDKEVVSWCVQGPCKYEKPSNADRIREMTDEEIEDWYWWMHKEMMYYTDSRAFVHDWLKEEVDNEAD